MLSLLLTVVVVTLRSSPGMNYQYLKELGTLYSTSPNHRPVDNITVAPHRCCSYLLGLGDTALRGEHVSSFTLCVEDDLNLLSPGLQGCQQTWIFYHIPSVWTVKLVDPGEARNPGKDHVVSDQKIKYITEIKYLEKTRTLSHKISPQVCGLDYIQK